MFSFLVRAVIIHTLAGRNGEIKTEETVSIQAGDRVRDPAARADRRSLLSGFLSTETTTARNIFTDAQRNLICLIVCRIIDERCGFRTEKSTCTFDYTLQIYSILLGGGKGRFDAIRTVPSKAFDSVDHNLLLSKFNTLGIGNPPLSWFGSTGRSRHVKILGQASSAFSVQSGDTHKVGIYPPN